jgi:MEDS: MEthanogen/methylotroph, DcmR Sensory domain
MAAVLEDLRALPVGAHALSLHASQDEALRNAVEFLAGAPIGHAVSYWVPTEPLAERYNAKLAEVAPEHAGRVRFLPTEQVREHEGKLRPVDEIIAFVQGHPRGVTAAGETISYYWNVVTMDAHLEYEAWFDERPRDDSRFLCPYDLRRIPSGRATEVLRSLGAHHDHIILSRSRDPSVRLLELFVFPKVREIPSTLEETLGWALRTELVDVEGSPSELELTTKGDDVVREWGDRALVG